MITTIEISPEQRESGVIAPEQRDEAVHALRTDGIVVLKDVIDTAHLDILRERLFADLETILARPDTPFQFNTGNVQQDPPPFPPYLFRDILLNEFVIAVTKTLLGPGLKNDFYSGNTALPGGSRQPVHPDSGHLWPDMATAAPAHLLVVNVPVVDMDAHNGSTEVWPGTHLDTSYYINQGAARVSEERLAARREQVGPIQPSVTRGSVVIRDMRLWHAGMPNHSDAPRPMIAMIHGCGWWPTGMGMPFPKGTEDFFAHPDLKTNARFVDEPIDYLHNHTPYDFQK